MGPISLVLALYVAKFRRHRGDRAVVSTVEAETANATQQSSNPAQFNLASTQVLYFVEVSFEYEVERVSILLDSTLTRETYSNTSDRCLVISHSSGLHVTVRPCITSNQGNL